MLIYYALFAKPDGPANSTQKLGRDFDGIPLIHASDFRWLSNPPGDLNKPSGEGVGIPTNL